MRRDMDEWKSIRQDVLVNGLSKRAACEKYKLGWPRQYARRPACKRDLLPQELGETRLRKVVEWRPFSVCSCVDLSELKMVGAPLRVALSPLCCSPEHGRASVSLSVS